VGIVWLLSNLNILPNNIFSMVYSFWPLLLIALGLDVMIGRRSPVVGGVLGLLFVGGLVALVLAGPAIGLPKGPEEKIEVFQEPLNSAEEATVSLDLHSYPVEISTLSDATNLVDATIMHHGMVTWTTSGDKIRRVNLAYTEQPQFGFFPFNTQDRWTIGLSPQVPLDLNVNSGSGSVKMDLQKLYLHGLAIDSGSGSVEVQLPGLDDAYEVSINSGSGSIRVDLPADTNLTMTVNSGSGSVNMALPSGVEFRAELRNGGSGSFNLPSGMTRISGNSDEDEGVWQTAGYENADYHLIIVIQDQGSGSVNIH
jgi:hypothetical protein